jgi:hypothetical protein
MIDDCSNRKFVGETTRVSATDMGRGIVRHVIYAVVCLLTAVALITLSTAVGLAQASSDSTRLSSVNEPTDYEGLFRNFKVAVDEGLFVKREFFSDQTLSRFFGKGRIIWHQRGPNQFAGEITRLAQPRERDPSQPRSLLEDVVVTFRRTSDTNGAVEANVILDILTDAANRLSFFDIERIFGERWTLYRNAAPNPHLDVVPATAPHGNDSILYRIEHAGLVTELLLRFSHDSRIKYARAQVSGH